MSSKSNFNALVRLAGTIDILLVKEATLLSINPELLDRIRGGQYANTSCSNAGCSNTNNGCDNSGCSPAGNNNNNCTNSGCN